MDSKQCLLAMRTIAMLNQQGHDGTRPCAKAPEPARKGAACENAAHVECKPLEGVGAWIEQPKKSDAPSFKRPSDPLLPRVKSVREFQLPNARETHEVFFDPVTSNLFLTQMSDSVLVKCVVSEHG